MAANLVPDAQYLRMSTENQQYSLQNQADAIAKYTADHGFQTIKTYSDAAKSGLRLQNRSGLKQLLKDVVEGQVGFRAVLVYAGVAFRTQMRQHTTNSCARPLALRFTTAPSNSRTTTTFQGYF